MILEVALGAAVLGAGSAFARWAWTRRAKPTALPAPTPAPTAPRPREGGLYPGDVLLYANTELALERGTELRDGVVLRVLEVIAAEPRFVVQLDASGEQLVVATPYEGLPQGRVADQVALGVRSLGLIRRGEALAETLGEVDGPFAGRCRFTVLADRGGRHLVVIEPDAGTRLCLVGDLVDRRLLEVLASG